MMLIFPLVNPLVGERVVLRIALLASISYGSHYCRRWDGDVVAQLTAHILIHYIVCASPSVMLSLLDIVNDLVTMHYLQAKKFWQCTCWAQLFKYSKKSLGRIILEFLLVLHSALPCS